MIAAIMAFLRGGGRRPEYWVGLLVAIAIITLSIRFASTTAQLLAWLAAIILWLILTLRRLRDIGWWAWLALIPILPVVIAVALVIASDEDSAYLNFFAGLLMLLACLSWTILSLAAGLWKPKAAPTPSPEQQAEVFG